MSSLPLVTIITPSFNQAAFLEQAICSVLGQDYPAIEYLVIDGGSNDGSREIIERYSDKLAWWVSEPDSGQAEAINKGFQRARGDFVAWLNSDDLYLPGAVSQAVQALNAEPGLGLVYGDAIAIDSSGKPLGRFDFDDWGLIDLVSFRIICQPAVFMRRSVLELAGEPRPQLSFHAGPPALDQDGQIRAHPPRPSRVNRSGSAGSGFMGSRSPSPGREEHLPGSRFRDRNNKSVGLDAGRARSLQPDPETPISRPGRSIPPECPLSSRRRVGLEIPAYRMGRRWDTGRLSR